MFCEFRFNPVKVCCKVPQGAWRGGLVDKGTSAELDDPWGLHGERRNKLLQVVPGFYMYTMTSVCVCEHKIKM